MDNRPIGVFDSGLGGISVLNHLTHLLPSEQFIYIADSAWCPYGTKAYEEIQNRAQKIVNYLLLTQDVKLVVVACNTATAAAIDFLRGNYDIPFVGMEPAIKPAAQLTKTNTVGVLATKNTFDGTLFKETSSKFAKNVNTIIRVGEGLVELVEENQVESPEAFDLIRKYTSPMSEANADHIVLGCTHYPFLANVIKSVAPGLKVIDPALPVAKRTQQLLIENDQLALYNKINAVQLFTTGKIEKLESFAENYVNGEWVASAISI
jgi:glutamate racemase